MSLRTAAKHNTVVLVGLLLFAGWTVLVGLNVLSSMGTLSSGDWVGQHGIGGLVGTIALFVILALTVLAYVELGESDPVPEKWPPS